MPIKIVGPFDYYLPGEREIESRRRMIAQRHWERQRERERRRRYRVAARGLFKDAKHLVMGNPSIRDLARKVVREIAVIPQMNERQFDTFLGHADELIAKLNKFPTMRGERKLTRKDEHRRYFLAYLGEKYPNYNFYAYYPKGSAQRKEDTDDPSAWAKHIYSEYGMPGARETMGSLRAFIFPGKKEGILNFT